MESKVQKVFHRKTLSKADNYLVLNDAKAYSLLKSSINKKTFLSFKNTYLLTNQ